MIMDEDLFSLEMELRPLDDLRLGDGETEITIFAGIAPKITS
jgi:hypothetical protein